VVSGQTQKAIAAADLAITKSGTVNLEIALLNVPQVVLTALAHCLDCPYFPEVFHSLHVTSNLVEMKPIVPELLQEQATPENIQHAALELLLNSRRQQTLADYQQMRPLGKVGVSDRCPRNFPAATKSGLSVLNHPTVLCQKCRTSTGDLLQ